MNRIRKRLIAATTFAVLSTAQGFAANTITVNWHNNTTSTITRNTAYNACQPGAGCNTPSTIASGATGVLTNTASNSTYVRSMTARYYYLVSGVTKSCQVTVSAYGPSSTWPGPGCEPNKFNKTFIKTDGTGTSPTCEIVGFTTDYPSCTFVLNVRITN